MLWSTIQINSIKYNLPGTNKIRAFAQALRTKWYDQYLPYYKSDAINPLKARFHVHARTPVCHQCRKLWQCRKKLFSCDLHTRSNLFFEQWIYGTSRPVLSNEYNKSVSSCSHLLIRTVLEIRNEEHWSVCTMFLCTAISALQTNRLKTAKFLGDFDTKTIQR